LPSVATFRDLQSKSSRERYRDGRVFLSGETTGDLLDDEFTHTYELNVGRY
jgi:hypothetical protein